MMVLEVVNGVGSSWSGYFDVDPLAMFRPKVFFYPDTGTGGGVGDTDSAEDSQANDNNTDDNRQSDNQQDDIATKIAELEKKHKKELDQYRNQVGQLKKQLKELQEKGMSEEEKLAQKAKEFEEKERELRLKELEAHKAKEIAEQGLDKRLADYIKLNAESTEDDISEDIQKLKTAIEAIVQERIEKLQESGTVFAGFGGDKKKGSGSIGELLAKLDKDQKATDAQQNYFFGG